MQRVSILLSLAFLAACTTPETVMRHPDTGQVVVCGGHTSGSLLGGAVGYYMQKADDTTCVSDYLEQGFKKAKPDVAPENGKEKE